MGFHGSKVSDSKWQSVSQMGIYTTLTASLRGLRLTRFVRSIKKGLGTERARLGTFMGFGTERARLTTLKKSQKLSFFLRKKSNC